MEPSRELSPLALRLHRRSTSGGVISLSLARRILRGVEAMSPRLPLLARLQSQRAVREHSSSPLIVHATWASAAPRASDNVLVREPPPVVRATLPAAAAPVKTRMELPVAPPAPIAIARVSSASSAAQDRVDGSVTRGQGVPGRSRAPATAPGLAVVEIEAGAAAARRLRMGAPIAALAEPVARARASVPAFARAESTPVTRVEAVDVMEHARAPATAAPGGVSFQRSAAMESSYSAGYVVARPSSQPDSARASVALPVVSATAPASQVSPAKTHRLSASVATTAVRRGVSSTSLAPAAAMPLTHLAPSLTALAPATTNVPASSAAPAQHRMDLPLGSERPTTLAAQQPQANINVRELAEQVERLLQRNAMHERARRGLPR